MQIQLQAFKICTIVIHINFLQIIGTELEFIKWGLCEKIHKARSQNFENSWPTGFSMQTDFSRYIDCQDK
jgi:hypothetical protein